MSMTPVRIVQQTPQNTSAGAQPKLQAGSVVQARVLAQAGAGQYVISVAGQKIAVRSETPLTQGAVFSAKISVRGEQVLFSLVGAQGEAKPLVSQFTASALQNGMDAGLSQLLASLGLPASAESFGLLQFAQAMGIKIDPRQLRKALAAAKQAGGGEEAAQTALVLDEKGLNVSADALKAVANGFGGRGQDERGQDGAHDSASGDEQHHNDGDRRHDENEHDDGELERARIAEDDDDTRARQQQDTATEALLLGDTGISNAKKIAAHTDGLSAENPIGSPAVASLAAQASSAADSARALVKGYVASLDEAAVQNKVGALTLFNSLRGAGKTDSSAGQWMLFPFVWGDDFSGVIRLLPEKNQKRLRQLVIQAKNLHKVYHFVVYYKQGTIDSVRFSTEPPLTDSVGAARAAAFADVLASLGGTPRVEYAPKLSGFCMADEPVATVRGAV